MSASEDIVLASPEFLNSLASLFPTSPNAASTVSHLDLDLDNPYDYVAAIAFSALGRPEEVPRVFEFALERLRARETKPIQRLRMTRRIRDGLFMSCLIQGFPKALQATLALSKVTPPELVDKEPLRDLSCHTLESLSEVGAATFARTYGSAAEAAMSTIASASPDLAVQAQMVGYGYVYGLGMLSTFASSSNSTGLPLFGDEKPLWNPVTISFVCLPALIATDIPTQTKWHLENAVRNGASKEQVRAVRHMCIRIVERCGGSWRTGGVPDLDD